MSCNEWKEYTLDEVCISITDGSHSSPKSVENGYPMASVKDMGYFEINIDSCRQISEEDYHKLVNGKCKPEINDVLIAKDGSYMKFVNVVKEEKDLVLLSSIAILKPNIDFLNPLFLKYYLLNPNVKQELEYGYVSGSAIRRIVLKDFKRFPIKLPPLEEQEKIANILSSLDDKIELNNEMNKTLEEMAQSIFKRWFVDFEFPNEDGEPYKSSGGEMVDSELGMIPKGWEVKTIGDIAEVTDYVANGSFASLKNNVKQGEEEDYAVLIRLVDYNRNFKGPFMYVDENGYKFLKKSTLFGGEIIISNVGANAGTVFKAPKLNKPMTLGPNSIMILKNEMDNYLYYYFNGYIGKEKLQTIIGGSAQPKFNKTDFRNIKIIVPNTENINKFNQILKPITDKLEEINIENSNLEDIRDNLLPKLMNGEIKLSS